MKRKFIHTASFVRSWKQMNLGDRELELLECLLLVDPEAGDVIGNLGGARKIRIPLDGRGKSGGGRVIYVDVVVHHEIYLLLAYPKNVQTNLTPSQEKILRYLVEEIKGDTK